MAIFNDDEEEYGSAVGTPFIVPFADENPQGDEDEEEPEPSIPDEGEGSVTV